MRQLLQLHHHKHTGKVLHHKHTSYRALFLVFAVAGVFMVFLSNAAKAADYVVTGTIPAPIPAGAPVIEAPTDGLIITTPNLAVSGTCPVIIPPIIVTLNDENSALGSGQCSSDGTFDVPIVLSPGIHHITGTVTTITGGTGETSDPVTVTYNPPGPPTVPYVPSATGKPSKGGVVSQPTGPAPLQMSNDTPFIVFGPTQDAIWRVSITGGTAPYRISIDWGDGTQDAFINRGGNMQAFSHHYNHLKSYRVTVRVTDAAGQGLTRVIAAISPATFNQPSGGAGIITSQSSLTTWIYALYGGLFGLFIIFWRYEHLRRQLQLIPVVAKKRRKKQNRVTR